MRGKKLFLVAALGLFGIPTIAHADAIHRLYNPNTGDHLMTVDQNEYQLLNKLGWKYEGIIGDSAKSGTAVYRLYNPYSGEHFFTQSAVEQQQLTSIGWKMEGVAFYYQDKGGQAVYRLYNPNTKKADGHFFTSSVSEKNYLVSIGWKDEGVAFYQAPAKTQETQPTEPAKEEPTPSKGEDTTVPKDNSGSMPIESENEYYQINYVDGMTGQQLNVEKDSNGNELPRKLSIYTDFSKLNINIPGYKYDKESTVRQISNEATVNLYYRKLHPITLHLIDFDTKSAIKSTVVQLSEGYPLSSGLTKEENDKIFGSYHVVYDFTLNADYFGNLPANNLERNIYVSQNVTKEKYTIHFVNAQDNHKEVDKKTEEDIVNDQIQTYKYIPEGYSIVEDENKSLQILQSGKTDYYFSVVPSLQNIKLKYYVVNSPDQDISHLSPAIIKDGKFDMHGEYYVSYRKYLEKEEYSDYVLVGNSPVFDWHTSEYSFKLVRIPKITFRFVNDEDQLIRDEVMLATRYPGEDGFYILNSYLPKGWIFSNPKDYFYRIESNEDKVVTIHCNQTTGGAIHQKLIDLDMNRITDYGEDITYEEGENIPQISETADALIVTTQSPIQVPDHNTVFLVNKDQLIQHIQKEEVDKIFSNIAQALNIHLKYDANKANYIENRDSMYFTNIQQFRSGYDASDSDIADGFMNKLYSEIDSRIYGFFYQYVTPNISENSVVSYYYDISIGKGFGLYIKLYYKID